VLLVVEIVTLLLFAVAALLAVYRAPVAGSLKPQLSWLNPLAISPGALATGFFAAVFLYWGWDSTVSVNEESNDARRAPRLGALVATLVLLVIYVLASVAAQAYAGPGFLVQNFSFVLSALGSRVLGSPLDKLLILSVLTSAAASTQTTILPRSCRPRARSSPWRWPVRSPRGSARSTRATRARTWPRCSWAGSRRSGTSA
jgi:amino acid transporter